MIKMEHSRRERRPELLAPAGDWQCAKAAVENGADAIYFGLEKFNARMRAHNFTESDLPRLMEFLHRRGVKGYLTFNTLVFQNEWEQAEEYLRATIAAGVDAAIVQDVGICRLIRQLSPDFPIHVSTQMTVTSAAGIEFARELGCNLVVLARECSLKEIEKIQQAQWATQDTSQVEPDKSPASNLPQGLPLEVFVHGALCVAYSGQCLTSEALGGRSANRGECAQACRMPYDLVSDGKPVALGDRHYLLSPQDLAGLDVLPELARLGVASLKIEGRLKSPEYVANITRIYRNALDSLADAEPDRGANAFASQDAQYEMEMAFSRGLSTGWFHGINNQRLVHARFGKKRGVYLGEVTRVQREQIYLRLEGPVKPGDGVVFDAGHPDQKEEGARVYDVKLHRDTSHSGNSIAVLGFGRGDLNFERIHSGDKVWKTSDPELDQRLARTFEGDTPRFQRPVSMAVHGVAGGPLTVVARDEIGHVVKVSSAMPLAPAQTQPLTTERLREQLGRVGGTAFKLSSLENQLEGEVLLPVSELNRLRREIVSQLEELRSQPPRWTLLSETGRARLSPARRESATPPEPCDRRAEDRRALPSGCEPRTARAPFQTDAHGVENATASQQAQLIVLVRNLKQLEAVIESKVETIYCEFEDPKKYRDAVSLFRDSACRTPRSALFVAPPRIFKMGEEWTLKQVRSSEADGYLVRNYDHLQSFADQRCVGDFSLNIANHLAAGYFKNKFGLERVTASYDLNCQQLEALLKAAPPEWFEVTIHQHIPMFHMEHCVFCAFLSKGTDYTNCGRPCDKLDLKLRDRVGAEHPVKADVGCRNTVFNALAQTGAEFLPRLMDLGVRNFRLEFLNESPEMVIRTIEQYRALLRGQITGNQLWRELKLLNQLGVTRGQMK
jgi:putative protease